MEYTEKMKLEEFLIEFEQRINALATLKDKMKINIKHNLEEYERLLHTIKRSDIPNKEQRIKDCEHAIKN